MKLARAIPAIFRATTYLAAPTLGAAFIVAPAYAQDIGIPNGFDIGLYKKVVIGAESGGNYSILNPKSFAAGAYQVMPVKMKDLGYVSGRGRTDSTWSSYSWTAKAQANGVSSLADFLGNSSFQDKVFKELTLQEWSRITSTAKATIGQVKDGVRVREGGLLSGAHFLGAGGLSRFVTDGFDGSNLNNLSLILTQNSMGSVTALNNYVMKRIKDGAKAHRDGEGAGAGTEDGTMSVSGGVTGTSCFENGIVTAGGEAVSSPFGVDRTGRASAGFHVGLDIVNSARRGSPMIAGLAGKVINARVGSVNGVTIETPDGRMRYAYLHNDTVKVSQGDDVSAGDLVSNMGDSGSAGAVHLHLMVALRADVVQAAGQSLGNVWSMGKGFGSKGKPLSSGAIPTNSETYLVVNPETFLNKRLPFQSGLLATYGSQGLSRPDGLTLEPTCGPSVDALNNAGMSASMNGGSTADGNIDMGTQAMASEQVMTALATEEARDAMIEYGYSSFYDLKRGATAINAGSQRAVGWAGMIAAYGFNNSN